MPDCAVHLNFLQRYWVWCCMSHAPGTQPFKFWPPRDVASVSTRVGVFSINKVLLIFCLHGSLWSAVFSTTTKQLQISDLFWCHSNSWQTTIVSVIFPLAKLYPSVVTGQHGFMIKVEVWENLNFNQIILKEWIVTETVQLGYPQSFLHVPCPCNPLDWDLQAYAATSWP